MLLNLARAHNIWPTANQCDSGNHLIRCGSVQRQTSLVVHAKLSDESVLNCAWQIQRIVISVVFAENSHGANRKWTAKFDFYWILLISISMVSESPDSRGNRCPDLLSF